MPIPHRAAAAAEPQPDLAQPDDHDVVAPRHRAAAEQPGQPAIDQPVDEARGERGLEDERGSIETVRNTFSPFGPSATSSLGSTVTSVLAAP